MSTYRDRITSFSMRTAAVLGAGAWGTALALALARANLKVNLWSRRSEHADAMRSDGENRRYLAGVPLNAAVAPTSCMDEAVSAADVVLLAAPSGATAALAESAARFAMAGAPAIICAKGLGENGALLSECVRRIWPAPVLVLSGPSFADEVARRMPTIVALAGPASLTANLAHQLSDDSFIMCPTADVTGVQVAGVFKNVAAILCGVSDGLRLGANARAALMSEAMREAASVIRALGGMEETLLGPAGFGDFALTCTDAKSRNYSFGRAFGEGGGELAAGTREGAANVDALVRLSRRLGVDAPLASAVSRLLAGGAAPGEAIEAAFAWRRHKAVEAVRAA